MHIKHTSREVKEDQPVNNTNSHVIQINPSFASEDLKTESDDVGQSMSDILIPCYPPDSLIELTRVQNGTDISVQT